MSLELRIVPTKLLRNKRYNNMSNSWFPFQSSPVSRGKNLISVMSKKPRKQTLKVITN